MIIGAIVVRNAPFDGKFYRNPPNLEAETTRNPSLRS
jgi:hypothetical protein